MFEDWYLTDLISVKIRNIWKLTDYYLLKLINNILYSTEMDKLLEQPVTIDEIITRKNYPPKVYSSISWMLDRLCLDGFIEKSNSHHSERYCLTHKKMGYNLDQILDQAIAEAPASEAAFNMLKLMADHYPDYLAGKKNGVDIIFSPENIQITNEYYNNNLFYNVHNIGGAKVLNWDVEQREQPVILEIGCGLGGGTKEFLLQRLENKLSLDQFTYHFTDIANKMLRTTKKTIAQLTENTQAFSHRKLDFNHSFKDQGIEKNSIDVIWGVNAAHVAKDLRFTLNEIYRSLKPQGSVIISETVRPAGNFMIQQEFLLNTLEDYWNVKLDPEIRPCHGFIQWSDWINALNKIGFNEVKTIPNMNELDQRYDNCYVAIMRGIKP